MPSAKKLIGITIGDPAGIGPEVIIKALSAESIRKKCCPVLIGPRKLWHDFGADKFGFTIIDSGFHVPARIKYGKSCAEGGHVAYEALITGIKLGQKRVIDALVTAPISKRSIFLAGYGFKGHTEILAEKCKCKNFCMMMAADRIFSLLITRHIPLKSVSSHLNAKNIVSQVVLCSDFLKEKIFGAKPRVCVTNVNPHLGEEGLVGDEEIKIIRPAVQLLRKKGIKAEGPVLNEVAYTNALLRQCELIVNMYHDQAMVPLKLINPHEIVNVTLGLPFLRTSPGHGVGYDIAQKDKANPASMRQAIEFAIKFS